MLLNQAEHIASKGEHKRAKETFSRAEFLCPELATLARDPASEFFLTWYERLFPMKHSPNGARADDS